MTQMSPLGEQQEEILALIRQSMKTLLDMEKAVLNEEYLIAYANLGALWDNASELIAMVEFELNALAAQQQSYLDDKQW